MNGGQQKKTAVLVDGALPALSHELVVLVKATLSA